MLARITRLVAVGMLVLIPVQATHAAFISDVSMVGSSGPQGDALAYGGEVVEGTPVEIAIACRQQYNASNPGDDVTRIQLSWINSSPGLNLNAESLWAWDPATDAARAFADDADMSDRIVNRQGIANGVGITDSSFDVGVLSFDAPAYVEGGDNSYVLNLTGGAEVDASCSVVADGDAIYLTPHSLGGMNVGDFAFTVAAVPEPVVSAILCLGALALPARKRKVA